MNDHNNEPDLRFAKRLSAAFRDQEIPPRPPVFGETTDTTDKPVEKQTTAFRRKPWLFGAASLGSVPVVLALVMLTISIWPNTVVEAPPNDVSIVDRVDPQDGDALVADEPPENPRPVVNRPATPALIREFNQWVNDRTYPVENLSERLANRMEGADPNEKAKAIHAAFKKASPVSGLKTVRPGLPSAASWAAGSSDFAYTYTFDVQVLLDDAARFVEGAMGDDVFDPILDGIRDDPEGPQVDLRRDLFAGLTGSVYLVASAKKQTELMLAIPVDLSIVPV
ncbi:MAG: hypothetical protein AAFN70_16935, partial [Planctomycetota bacterium]